MRQWQSNSATSLPTVFSAWIQVRNVAVSKVGYTNLILTEPGAKINREYYREVLPMQNLLPVISRSIPGDVFVFQQDNASTHCTHDVVEFLCHGHPIY